MLPAAFLLASVLSAAEPPAALDDGPHVFWEGSEARVVRLVDAQASEERRQAPFRLDLPGVSDEGLLLDGRPPEPAPLEMPLPRTVLAVSDVHGRFEALRRLLRAHRVTDDRGRWTFGTGHLVVVGDVVDKGPRQTECLWLLRSLEPQARRAGGRVHLLLGNHEGLNLRSDYRYAHPRYRVLRERGGDPLSPESELGRFLRSRSAALKLGPWLFLHAGVGPAVLGRGASLADIEAGVKGEIGSRPEKAFWLGSEGPLWYRGLIPGRRERGDATPGHVADLLARFGVRGVVVGHSSLERVTAFHGGRVIGVDSGLQYGRAGEVLVLDRGRPHRGLPDGRRERLRTSSLPAVALRLQGRASPFPSSEAPDGRVALSPDGRRALWGSALRPGGPGGADVWEAPREGKGWGSPRPAPFAGPHADHDPVFAPDGRGVYFASDRPGGLGGSDIYFAPFDPVSGTYGEAANLGPAVNTAGDERAPALSADGRRLLYATDGRRGRGLHDLFLAVRDGDLWQAAGPLPGPVNTEADEVEGVWLGGERVLVFTRRVAGGSGATEILASPCGEDGGCGRPARLGPEVNGPRGSSRGPSVGAAEPGVLYFVSGPPAATTGRPEVLGVRYRLKPPR